MSTISSFRDFDAYKEARALVKNLYALTRRKPISSDYALCDQMQRAAISIPSHFAEGYEREGKQEFIQFISYAKGSTGEIMAQLDIALDQEYITTEQHQELDQAADKVRKLLAGLRNYLRKTGLAGLKFKRTENSKPKTVNDNRKSEGFAIISTLLVLTVLTIMVVAFMQSMRIERLTARSYLNKTRADLIAQAAAQKAITQIIQNTRNPGTGLVDLTYTVESVHPNISASTSPDYTSYAPVTFISRYEKSGSTLLRKATPLISTALPEAGFQTGVVTDFNNNLSSLFAERTVTANNTDLNIRGNIQSLNTSINSSHFRVPLIEITDPDNKFRGRYGYMVLDEQARLNPVHHRSAVRDLYAQTAKEMPLSTGGNLLLTPAELTAFLAGPVLPASPFAIGQYFSTSTRAKDRRHLFGYYDVKNQDVIPAIYTEAGKPKYNLNLLATDTAFGATATARAENIAAIIDNNLPTFKLRDPSLASETAANQRRYLNRLSASIVDYIDTDTGITTVNGGEPAGRDLFPLVTTIAEHYSCGSESGSGPYSTTVQSRVFIQIWNPYTTPVTGSARITIRNRMRVRYGTGIVTPFATYSPAAVNGVTVRPNEFVVVSFPFVSQTFSSPTGPNTSTSARPNWLGSSAETSDQTTWVPFEFEWNGQRVDMSRRSPVSPGTAHSGMTRNAKTLAYNALHYQIASIPTFSHLRTVGDPRFTYLSNYDWGSPISGDGTYASNTFWKGRNRDTEPYNQNFVSTWSQRDYVRRNPIQGAAPGGINSTPASVTSPYVETVEALHAPLYIRNNAMQSIGELGHIFDPIQSDNTGAAPSGGSPGSIFVAGGGRSLRIGQPEFNYLNTDGRRAMQLLDLFTVNTPTVAGEHPEYEGRININTAPSEVLQALFYNIEIKSDEGFHQNIPANISKTTEAKAKILADAIIKDRRDNGYYTKLSDLYRIFSMTEATSSTAAWNRAEAYEPKLGANATANSAPEVMDRAREELFAKTVNLMDTQSRAFRIFTTGQALGPLGNVVSRSYLETLLTLEASTDSSGVVSFKPRIIHERYY